MVKYGNHELIARQKSLTEKLMAAARAYYAEDAELMSNFEYDKLYDELSVLEAQTGTIFAGSPTQRVGYEVSSELVKQEHTAPMLSLNKTKSTAELADWLGEREGLLSYKLDGLTVALTYRDGSLSTAVTRGNGAVGEVVTAGARTFLNLPLKIPYTGTLVLRGEAVIRYSDFEKINRDLADADAKYKNPRNLVSGSVRQLDSAVTARRRVRFYAFALVEALPLPGGEPWRSRLGQMEFLRRQGFETVEYELVDAEALAGAVADFSKAAAEEGFDLPVDGLVAEYDDVLYSESLGATTKFPHDAIAFKWQDEEAETELLEIEWSASRTGLINPIAVFRPVALEGTTISRASVHNVSILEELALGVGDTIKVYKANMIIPQISENLTRSGTVRPPEGCPICGAQTKLVDVDGVKTLHCTNGDCPVRRVKAFSHFVSRPCLNIEGLSEQTLEKFIAAGFLHELADIFHLEAHREKIVTMEGFGTKSYEKLMTAIERARATTADRLLAALGLPEVGVATARQIARSFGGDWDQIMDADEAALSATNGVGSVIAELYTGWFSDPGNRAVAQAVRAEVRLSEMISPAPAAEKGKIFGKTFVITGSLTGYKSRELLKEKIEALGGKTAGSVSAKTDYLINNDAASASSKNKAARALGVAVITETEFEAMAEARGE